VYENENNTKVNNSNNNKNERGKMRNKKPYNKKSREITTKAQSIHNAVQVREILLLCTWEKYINSE